MAPLSSRLPWRRRSKILMVFGLAAATVAAVLFAVALPGLGPAPKAEFNPAIAVERGSEGLDDRAPAMAVVPFTRPAERPLRAMVAGTSLTAGYYTKRLEYTYASRVFQGLREKGAVDQVVANRVEGGLTLVSSYPDMPAGLDLAVVELGTNDSEKVEIEEFRKSYTAMMAQIRDRSPSAAIYCLGPWRDGVVPYVVAIQDACRSVGGTYIQMGDLYLIDDLHGPAGTRALQGIRDEFHPNDSGHFLIAERVLSVIEPAEILSTSIPAPSGSSSQSGR